MLAYPDHTQPSKVYTDASSFAIGGVLSQDLDGSERVICYVGRSLNSAERNYGITEKECLALVYTFRKLDCYLRYSSFTAIVDHSALKWLFSLKDPTGKFARWITLLQAYDFQIVYRPGKIHQNADGISRREYTHDTDEDVNEDDSFPLIGADFDILQNFPKPVGRITAVTTERLKQQPRKQPSPQLTERSHEVMQATQNMFQHDHLQQMQEQDEQFQHILAFLQAGILPTDSAEANRVLKLQDDYFVH